MRMAEGSFLRSC
uniref:Uncharacterized protein n=1 Tax=Anguilla anguilla TaxID=7936 RepID=A0A0E9SNG1_ANGAN